MKKVINIVEYILIGFFAVIIVFSLGLYICNYRAKIVLSGSMEPRIYTGSLMYYKKISESDVYDVIKNDTIITYEREDGKAVTHRVISYDKEKDIIITKGIDENSANDAPIKASQVKGIYAFSIPILGFIINFIRNPFVILSIAIIVVLVILFNSLYKLLKTHQKDE